MNPHEALFKAVFSRPERAAEELRHVLPPELPIDFTTLRHESGSFVDDELRERHADLLFSATCGGAPIRVYVLLEHQSSVDPWMPLRLLGYMLRIWEAIVKAQPDARRLPPIVPVVVHHSETGWRAATAFGGLIEVPPDAPGLLEFVPQFRFALDDLSKQSEAAIVARVGSACTRLVLAALRSARGPQELAQLLRGWLGLIREVSRETEGVRALRQLFRYLSLVRTEEEYNAIDVAAIELPTDEEGTMRTLAEFMEERGEQKGLAKGLEKGVMQGRREMLLLQLRQRFGELPQQVVGWVEAGDSERLKRWGIRVVGADSLEAIFFEEYTGTSRP
jgi:hypothetical protein